MQQLGKDDRATIDGGIVVLAVPYSALADILSRFGDQMIGKVVVDITNPDRSCAQRDGGDAVELI